MSTQYEHVFIASRVYGSRDGGSAYSKAIVELLLESNVVVTILAERFGDGGSIITSEKLHWIQFPHFFKPGFRSWLHRWLDALRFLKEILFKKCSLLIVQGDLPRLTYLLLQFFVPLLFIRQDSILTCPANNRFLPRSRKTCRKTPGFSCLAVNTREGCLENIPLVPRIGRIIYRIRDNIFLRCLSHFVVNSAYMANIHRRRANILYPPNLSAPAVDPRIGRNLKQLLFCGRLEGIGKGADDAVKILASLPSEYHLVLLGDGPQKAKLMELVKTLDIESRVQFHGWVDPQRRNELMASAGVLIMPSLWDEAFGMVGIEAFTQGTPAVAYNVGGISEWCLPGAGELVNCGDVLGAVQAIKKITADPEHWESYSKVAQSIAAKQYSPQRFKNELRPLIHQLTGIGID